MIDTLSQILLQVINGVGNCNIGPIPFNPVCFLGLGPTIWFPIFMAIITVVIAIIAVIYMLSPLLGRNDIKTWARIKIYDVLLTVVLAVVFLVFSGMLYSIDPTSAYGAVGLLPQSCSPTVMTNTPTSVNVNNLYALSVCDMYQYNQNVMSFSNGMFWLSLGAGLAPSAAINIAFLEGGPQQLPSTSTSSGVSPGIGFALFINLMPITIIHQYVVPLMGAYFAAVILAQVQELLLSSAMIIFSIFMIIGFTARAFGVTKTFGGSMIAFALGFGFIYPLITTISYGFLDVVLENAQIALHGSILDLFQTLALSLVGNMVSLFFGGTGAGTLSANFTPLLINGGFIASGLLIIPLLNLIIVDAFIVDVSRVIGERMELMSLLTRIV